MITPVPDGWTQLPGRILPIEGFFGASRSDLPHEIDELARFESLVAAQGRVLDRLTADEDLSHVLLVIARMVEAHTAALCAILIVDTAGATLRAGAIPTLPETFVTAMNGLKIESVAGSCGTAAFRRAPVVSPDISNDPLWSDHRELMMSLGVLAAWSLPVIAPGGDVVATLAMYANEQRLPDEWEMRVAGLAVSLTALAIQRSGAARTTLDTDAGYRLLWETSPDAVMLLDEESRIQAASPAMLQVFGYAPDEVIGRDLAMLQPERLREAHRAGMRRYLASGEKKLDWRATRIAGLHKDGHEFAVELAFSDLQVDGTRQFAGFARDVSERARAEDALKQAEARYRALAENAFDLVCELDSQGRFAYVSPNFKDVLGYEPETLLGQSPFALIHDDDRERVFQQFAEAISEQAPPGTSTFRLQRQDETWCWLEVSANFYRDEAGESHAVILARDIAQRMAMEATLRVSEERLRTFVEHAPLILTATDREGRYVLQEGAGLARFGIGPGEHVGQSIFELYADQPRVCENLRRALAGESFADVVELFGVTFEVHHEPVRDEAGDVAGMIAILIDVTARVRAEEALRESEDRLRTVVGNVPVILFATDREGVYTLSEGAGLRSVGLEPGQYVGQSIFDVYPGLPQVTDGARRALAGEAVTYLLRLGGVAMDVHLSPVRDKTGEITGSIGVAIDVSDRQRAEDGMNRRAEELEQMYRRLAETHAELEESKQHLEEKSSLLEHALELERERSRHDQLTGTLNHAAITDAVREMIRADAGRSLAIAMVDVDGLKAANDTYGHQVGDAVLVLVAQKLMLGGAIVGRYGGDEFVAIVPGADRVAAEQYRDDVLASLIGAGLTDERTGAHIPVVASMGLAIYPEEAGAVDDVAVR